MFDLGWAELLVIGVVALIIVGPKDLPKLFRTLGQFTGKARAMAREFSSAMNQAADESGMKDIKDTVSGLKDVTNPSKLGLDAVKDATKSFQNFDPDSETGRLSKERAEKAQKIREAAEQKARERRDREAAEQSAKIASQSMPEPAAKTEAPAPAAEPAPAEPKASEP